MLTYNVFLNSFFGLKILTCSRVPYWTLLKNVSAQFWIYVKKRKICIEFCGVQ